MIHRVIRTRQVATPLLDRQVFGGLIGTVARGFTWKQRWDASLASSFAVSCLGEQSSRKAVGLLEPGPRSEGTQYQCPNEAPGAQRGQWTRKYIHTKIEANLLKSVAYKMLIYTCHCLTLYCTQYFIARRQIRCIKNDKSCNRGLMSVCVSVQRWWTHIARACNKRTSTSRRS